MCDMGKIQSSALEIHKAVTVSYRLFPRPMEAALLVDWSAVSAVCVYSFFFFNLERHCSRMLNSRERHYDLQQIR